MTSQSSSLWSLFGRCTPKRFFLFKVIEIALTFRFRGTYVKSWVHFESWLCRIWAAGKSNKLNFKNVPGIPFLDAIVFFFQSAPTFVFYKAAHGYV